MVVSWPAGETGALEINDGFLNPRGWKAITAMPTEEGGRFEVEIPLGTTPSYFRLNSDDEAIPPTPM
jgi:hypothetical protein